MEGDALRALIAAGQLRAASEQLYAALAGDVARFVRSRVPDEGRAADVCQEVWLAVETGLRSFRGDGEPRIWLFSIARNKSMDAWRRAARNTTLDSSMLDGPLGAIVASVETPTRKLRLAERAAAIRAALAALDDDDREVLEMRYVAELKPREIAVILDYPTANAVSQKIVRIAKRLREALASADITR